ncbi:MAG: NUDIX domain-containing protein [Flavobacteriales bacterium]|nr:NUDIX domain-containing protein [Flavobacteriales bacterium]
MYKVFVNESLLIFSENPTETKGLRYLMALPGETEKIVRNLLNGVFSDRDYLIPMPWDEAEKYLKENFEHITAAGGIVTNPEGKILWIFRRNKWDLPKGKADEGETVEETALREVKEECGIKNLALKEKVGCAYHIYPITKGKKAVFKVTHFFRMETTDTDFTPQAEEEITRISFFSPQDETPFQNTFRSLREFINDVNL